MGSTVNAKKTILSIGLACVDIICVTESYPEQDSDERALEQRLQRGGNAANICTVLNQLHSPCEFLGTLASDENTRFILEDFKYHNIPTDHCVFHKKCHTPMSIVIINSECGSRTIIGGIRDLPGLLPDDFRAINLATSQYKLIHFEGRPNVQAISQMIQMVDTHNARIKDPSKRIKTSLEIEKDRDGIGCLLGRTDYVFVSKDFAKKRGYNNMYNTALGFAIRCKYRSSVIIPWGEMGAAAFCGETQTLVSSPGFPPPAVIDTLGAGDTFIASTLSMLVEDVPLSRAIAFGCKVAGAKCGMKGFKGLQDIMPDTDNFNVIHLLQQSTIHDDDISVPFIFT